MSSLMPIDEALASVLESAVPVAETSRVPLSASSGRILGVSVTSAINVPPADNSAMDGYAMDAADTDLVSGGTYRVSDRIPAGSRGQPLEAGTLVRIFTGGEIPPGANAVVMQENTREAGTDRVALLGKPEVGQNVREKGQDIRQGQQILVAGKRLTPQDIGLLASIGCDEVEVYRPLRVGILATGNELVDPPKPLGPGQIYNSNRFSLASLVSNLGMEPCYFGTVQDTPEATREALAQAASSCDCLVSSGGVSVGEEDHVKAQVESLGELQLWKIAIKPGKPLAFGSVLGKPFFGLPGNPVSAFVTFCLITRPYLLKQQGAVALAPESYLAPADFDFQGGSRTEFLRVQVAPAMEGHQIRLYPNQGSGVMSSLSWANALAEVAIDQTVRRGDMLPVYPLRALTG